MASELVGSVAEMFKEQMFIDITEKNFLWSVFHAFLNFFMWMLVPHFEFRYNILSRFMKGDKARACDFLSFFLIQTGALRNLAFNEAINQGIKISYGKFDLPLEIIGATMIAAGALLIIITFYRMGIRGMYFGDHFGFLFDEKITAFPFSHLDNPQYVGTTTFFVGCALYYHSPAGAFLAGLTYILYSILNVVEGRKLVEFYPPNRKVIKKN